MCRNHSHITAVRSGLLTLDQVIVLDEYRMGTPLEVQGPYSEKRTLPSGTAIYLPASRMVPLPASPQAQMVVCYVPILQADAPSLSITPGRAWTPQNAGKPGLTGLSDTATYPKILEDSDDEPAF
jgi:hypothetical protein